jgi:hypothetical protein
VVIAYRSVGLKATYKISYIDLYLNIVGGFKEQRDGTNKIVGSAPLDPTYTSVITKHK